MVYIPSKEAEQHPAYIPVPVGRNGNLLISRDNTRGELASRVHVCRGYHTRCQLSLSLSVGCQMPERARGADVAGGHPQMQLTTGGLSCSRPPRSKSRPSHPCAAFVRLADLYVSCRPRGVPPRNLVLLPTACTGIARPRSLKLLLVCSSLGRQWNGVGQRLSAEPPHTL